MRDSFVIVGVVFLQCSARKVVDVSQERLVLYLGLPDPRELWMSALPERVVDARLGRVVDVGHERLVRDLVRCVPEMLCVVES